MQQNPTSRSSSGYPNPNTPEQSNANPYQNHNPPCAPHHHNPRTILIRRLFIVSMVFLLILGLILVLYFGLISPQLPYAYINSLSLSNFNVSNNHLTGNWDLQLRFQNPNSKMSLCYNAVFCTLYYNRVSLSETRLQPLDQGKKDETPINATLSVSGSYVEARLADSIGKERAVKGSVEFDLRLTSSVTFRYGVYRRRRYVTVYCYDVLVGVPANSSSGKMVGSAKRCKSF
ncbi:Late embryogenesis abundant (LEA) hydroxyproline-rich glycoprotein family [Raphanus sativus]|uniref:NDR1/HIN1-like protein 3 n=1 Tax=Raphanus sativus TaxID=3726 RepID=A0A6J0LIP3_RAPSA|nr:NDR1/HIN1-like protein 3 [Raphanus sativus]KAJ4873149.1 Late embryogenesis abundant (LEA) hydroxyproline-rich glycoprotein family [Raphanus sativus]